MKNDLEDALAFSEHPTLGEYDKKLRESFEAEDKQFLVDGSSAIPNEGKAYLLIPFANMENLVRFATENMETGVRLMDALDENHHARMFVASNPKDGGLRLTVKTTETDTH
jgi:hypothetical protein